jgi:hypothetical protein
VVEEAFLRAAITCTLTWERATYKSEQRRPKGIAGLQATRRGVIVGGAAWESSRSCSR